MHEDQGSNGQDRDAGAKPAVQIQFGSAVAGVGGQEPTHGRGGEAGENPDHQAKVSSPSKAPLAQQYCDQFGQDRNAQQGDREVHHDGVEVPNKAGK